MISTVDGLLAQLIASASSERDKGDKFERLVRKWLSLDTAWAQRFSQVFMWSDWPGRDDKPDHGIDLVAIEADTGDPWAVQCKFYAPDHYLTKPDVDTFLSESGKRPFVGRLIVSTTDKWNSAAESAIKDQQIPVTRIGLTDLIDSSIDWSQFNFTSPDSLERKPVKTLRPHQESALADVRSGFGDHERGKLIMACGTGKTFTSLRIAEDLVGAGGAVLFLVPSIALLSQSLKEWSQEALVPLRTFAVCSDAKVGKDKGGEGEDISVVDLEIPATTDPARLVAQMSSVIPREVAESAPSRMTVIFSTYQSIDVIHQAQQQGLGRFDLIVCDEAHRTTGATLAGDDESAFVRIHDDAYIGGDRRLYMTATPRIYDDASKAKARDREEDVLLASMDDETLFGPEFHRLDFGQAVAMGLLADYRVLILAVSEQMMPKVIQSAVGVDSELRLSDAAKIIGCWNGLSKRADTGLEFPSDPEPMKRAVAFCDSIKTSRMFAERFSGIVDDYTDMLADEFTTVAEDGQIGGQELDLLDPEVDHVDGTMNILKRNAALDWLRSEPAEGHCRILTNARCLAEGVDVPALDAVIFLNPRKSEVDVVQAVGRVMRQAPGKKYGYIVLPIGIPAGEKPDVALRNNERYKIIWSVLQALRAHDSRFNAMINQIDLNHKAPAQIGIGYVTGRDGNASRDSTATSLQDLLPADWAEWKDAIFAKIVDKVGSRRYWEDWAKDVADIVAAHTARLAELVNSGNWSIQAAFDTFLKALRANLNDSIDAAQAIDMLSQHMVTKPVFDALFDDYQFSAHNPVAQVMQNMLDALEGHNLESETASLDKFYESVRERVQGIDNAEGKQRVLMELYEKFFRLAFKKTSESLGIVYTPVEIVDFIIRSVDYLLHEHFGQGITDEGVHILDPFTGTGTFIVRLLESGLIRTEDLARKYTEELHANEILLLAYYIAAANIEVTYHALAQQSEGDYTPFQGIVLADTFQMTEAGDTLDDKVFVANNDRAAAQLKLPIQVIVGNPPYSVGQSSGNDDNPNQKYPSLDARIMDTYAARSTAVNKNSLYDSYIRAIRWASDRVGDNGIVGFVTNGGFIDGNTADGLRLALASEFDNIYVYNLRGNRRASGTARAGEGRPVFEFGGYRADGTEIQNAQGGALTTIAVVLLVKGASTTDGTSSVRYVQVPDGLSAGQKLALVAGSFPESVPWEHIVPNPAGDWINQRNDAFDSYLPVDGGIFGAISRGLETGRDAWVYSFSSDALRSNMTAMAANFNRQVIEASDYAHTHKAADATQVRAAVIDRDSTALSWTSTLEQRFDRRLPIDLSQQQFTVAAYRPFVAERVCLGRDVNHRAGAMLGFFPTVNHPNVGFCAIAPGGTAPFSLIAVDSIPDLHILETSQFMPRWRYEDIDDSKLIQGALAFDEPEHDVIDGYRRIDNITDGALASYRQSYGSQVSKGDLFYHVYGLLHSPDYRETFAADLKKMLPRIPKVDTRETFEALVKAGRELFDLHVNYEQVDPWPGLTITGNDPQGDEYAWFHVDKMAYGKQRVDGKLVADKTQVVYNPHVTVSGIPPEAQEYMLGARSAIDWIIERYQIKTDKPSGIVNDPNDWSKEHNQPRYILDLLTRIVTVSVRTAGIVNALPQLSFDATGASVARGV